MRDLFGYDIVILDTSPSLGALNRSLLSLADGFIIPCAPDLFSVYGIRNIGNALDIWRKQFDTIFHFLSDSKRESFPRAFVKFLGYTLYNAKKRSDSDNELGIAKSHYNYARQIPTTIERFIKSENTVSYDSDSMRNSIGDNAIIYTHNTFPSFAQKYHKPMWQLPLIGELENVDQSSIRPNAARYHALEDDYKRFAVDLMQRIEGLYTHAA